MRRCFLELACLPLMLIGMLGVRSAIADGIVVGSFEIDGNTADDSGAGEPIDWKTPPPNRISFVDLKKSTKDDAFGQGTKELEPGGWSCVQGGVPAKDDIVGGEIAFRTVSGKQFAYVSWQRAGVNGDAHIDYEFNQSSVQSDCPGNPPGSQIPTRSDGDLLIAFDTENGGKIILVRAFEWQFTGPGVGTFLELPLGEKHVTWEGAVNIAPSRSDPGLEPGAFGEAAINLTDTIGEIACGRFASVYMKTRASSEINAELKDRTQPLPLGVVEPAPELANAMGSAFAARVQDSGLKIDQTLPDPPAVSSQSGIGTSGNSNQVLDVDVPPPSPGSLLQADVLRASSTSRVTKSPAAADQTSTAETIGLNLLGGTITASLVRAAAFTRATGGSPSYSSAGSALKDLMIDPDGPAGPLPPVAQNVAPNTTVDLSAAFGQGSYVKLYEEIVSTSSPPPGSLSGGTYAVDLTVNMIRVHLTDRSPLEPGLQTTEIIISQAVAHSDFPASIVCPGRFVSGHALVASEITDLQLLPLTLGFVEIPPTGGESEQHLDSLLLGTNGVQVSADASDSRSTGTVAITGTSASSNAHVANPCVLNTGACTVSATVVNSQANSNASLSGATSNDSGTELLGVKVGTTLFATTPPRNTVVTLDGIGFVVLNEQFCDGSALLPPCSGTTHSGLTIRGIRLVVTVPSNPAGLTPGTEIIVAEAHSDASFPK
jgi:hypothetical protein